LPNASRHRPPKLIVPLLIGLLVSQLIATVVVYQSNRHLDRKITALSQAGYLTIPTPNTQPGLSQMGSAWWGGLFFTLSTGAGISLLTILAVRAGRNMSRLNRWFSLILLILPAGLLGWVNLNGFNLPATLFFTIVPAAVVGFSTSDKRYSTKRQSVISALAPVAALVILTGCWLTQLDRHLFINIRDFVLLSNPAGVKINDFYYRYTLYPAELFKTLSQKTLRTYTFASQDASPTVRRLHRTLKRYDYLPVKEIDAADVVIRSAGNRLTVEQHGRTLLDTDIQRFLRQPRRMLQNLSVQADRFEAFRQITFFSILFTFPVSLFLLINAGLSRIIGLLFSDTLAAVMAAVICLVLGLVPLIAVYAADPTTAGNAGLSRLLSSDKWQDRIIALRTIDREGIEIGDFPQYRQMLSSTHMPERYWLARALGASRKPATYNDLLKLLQDQHPNVVCQAFYGLGRRGDKNVVPVILKKIETLDNWYSQRYGYNALKRLGWVQTGNG